MLRVHIEHCSDADYEHARSIRQYAHTFHRGPDVICVAKAYFGLPPHLRAGIFLHELGHLAGGDSEDDADVLAEFLSGIRIRRIDTQYGRDLESV
jgi:hypothetical protein